MTKQDVSAIAKVNRNLREVLEPIVKAKEEKNSLGGVRINSIIDTALMFVTQYYDELPAHETVIPKDVFGAEFRHWVNYLYTLLSGSIRSEEGYITNLINESSGEDRAFIVTNVNNGRVAQFDKFLELYNITKIKPRGEILQPVIDSFLEYLRFQKASGKGKEIDRFIVAKFVRFILSAYDKLARFKKFAEEFEEFIAYDQLLQAMKIANKLEDASSQKFMLAMIERRVATNHDRMSSE